MLLTVVARRKLFGIGIVIVGVASGAGIAVAGCSDDPESRVILPEEASTPKETSTSDSAPGATCPSADPVDPSLLGWKPPTNPQEGKCQADDVVAMRDYLAAEPNATNEDFLNFVKNRDPVCHECIFGDAKNQTWPPAPVLDGKVVTFNVGACYALVTGKQACGQAVQNGWDCSFEACVLCTSAAELETCRAKARATTCKTYEDKAKIECAGPPDSDSRCGSPFDSIRVQCVTASADAGKL